MIVWVDPYQGSLSSKSPYPFKAIPVTKALTDSPKRIVDDDDNTIDGEGAFGNIFVKAPWPMLGYVDNEKATIESLPGNGWVRTGDVGQYVHGKVWIVDRKKDLIKVRTWQVSPAEVESVILQHPKVLDAAVIGVSNEDSTDEIPRAYVILQPDSKLQPEDLKAFVGKSLAKYKLPEQIVFVDQIPKNSTGKILRRILREEAAKGIKVEVDESTSSEDSPRGKSWNILTVLSAKLSGASRYLGRLFSWFGNLFRQH